MIMQFWCDNEDGSPMYFITSRDTHNLSDYNRMMVHEYHGPSEYFPWLPPPCCKMCGAALRNGEMVIYPSIHADHFWHVYVVDEAQGGWSRGNL